MNPTRMKRMSPARIWMFCSLIMVFKSLTRTGPDWSGLISRPLRVAHEAQSRRIPRPIMPPLSTHSAWGKETCSCEVNRGELTVYPEFIRILKIILCMTIEELPR